ncbi:HD domain-containing protein [Flavobacterium sp. ZT3R17]|uniref:HD domain-containing protein n=1 Tax=Flavobacterium cryoconiti TaxID=3398736 RepID=UPI003A8787B4
MEYSNPIIEGIFHKFKPILGEDCNRYKNHVYRVFLNCLLMDSNENNIEKYAIAAVFHDIGIWTAHTIDYLYPSIEQANLYLTESGKQEWIEEITLMIYWHHRMSHYQGKHKITVEYFRKADWMDVSLGLINFGFDRQKIKAFRKKLPNLGFHLFLLNPIFKNFFNHPFNPLPMFKN